MNPADIDELYRLQRHAEVLRVIIDEDPVDRFTLVTRKLEACLGERARDEPWFSAIAPIRRSRWRIHAIPLPSDHEAIDLTGLLAQATTTTRRLAAGASDELKHWVSESLESLRELATTSSSGLSHAIDEMLVDGSDTAATLLVNDAWCIAAVSEHFESSRVPPTAILTPATLRNYQPHSSQLVIGASRVYPDWIFTAPRAGQVTVVQRASARDRGSVDPPVPNGGLPPVTIGGQRMKRLAGDAFCVDPAPINWGALRPQTESPLDPQMVRARTFLLAGNRSVLIEDSSAATVFTVTPGAASGDLIHRVPASTVDAGSCVLLRQRGGDDDTILQLANRILGDRRDELRGQQHRWKEALRRAVRRDGYYRAHHALDDLGCDADNLDRWLGPDAIRTRTAADFLKICSYAGIPDSEARTIWSDMGEIHSAHVRAGHRLREMLEDQLVSTNLEPLETIGHVEVRLPKLDAGMLAVYRVEARDTEMVLAHPRRLRIAVRAGGL